MYLVPPPLSHLSPPSEDRSDYAQILDDLVHIRPAAWGRAFALYTFVPAGKSSSKEPLTRGEGFWCYVRVLTLYVNEVRGRCGGFLLVLLAASVIKQFSNFCWETRGGVIVFAGDYSPPFRPE